MIQPEPEGSTLGYPLVSVEVLRYEKRSKSENMGIVPTEMELILEQTQQGICHEVSMILTLAGNPVNEILLKLNLPNHRSILMDSQVTLNKHGRITKPYSSHRFIANCFNAGHFKMEVKRQSVNVKDLPERCIYKLSSYQIKKGSDWSDQAKDGPTNFALMAYTSSSSLSSSKSYTEPPKPNLVFADEHVVSEFVTSLPGIAKIKVKTSESKLKTISKPIIEDYVSDSEDENKIEIETK
nr:hypothetical protein [Tanacetum cinerariifolium]